MTVRVSVEHGLLAVRAPYFMRDQLRRIPGSVWSRSDDAWLLPMLPESAEELKRASDRAFQRVRGDDDWLLLLDAAREAYRLRTGRESRAVPQPDLPDIPGRTSAWPHQRAAFHKSVLLDGPLLGMDMGTGKTRTMIALLEAWDARLALAVTPVVVMGVWPAQIGLHATDPERWLVQPLRGSGIEKVGQARRAVEQIKLGRRVLLVVNYESAWRQPLGAYLARGVFKDAGVERFDVVLCDESHRIAGHGSTQSRYASGLGRRAAKRACLTGTPMPQTPLDIFGQARFLGRYFGNAYHPFKQRYGVFGGFEGRKLVGIQNGDELGRIVGQFTYLCDADDVLDLPETTDDVVEVALSPKTRRAYRELQRDFVAGTEQGLIVASNAGARIVRLQQLTSGHTVTDEQGVVRFGQEKALALREILADQPEGDPAVVFCLFRPDLDQVREVAGNLGRTYHELSGAADELTEDRKVRPDTDVLGVQIQAGGVGVDLTASRVAVYFSMGWSLTNYLQSRKRLHRPGQRRPVRYLHLVAGESVDEQVYRSLSNNEDVVRGVLRWARGGRGDPDEGEP